MSGKNDDSAAPRNSDGSSRDHAQTGTQQHERPLVLITGDSFDLPLELGSLLRNCGYSAFVTTDLETSQSSTCANPEAIIVNFANAEAANPDRVRALREQNDKPIVCLMPHPTEREIVRAAALRADLLIFKPLRADEFRSRMRILLWEQRPERYNANLDHERRGPNKDVGEVSQGPKRLPGSFLQVSERDNLVVRDGGRLHLTPKEYELLSFLASDPERVFSIDEIIRSVGSVSRRAMASDVHRCIYVLRQKIEKDPRNPRHIITVLSSGYRLRIRDAPVSQASSATTY